MAELRGAREPVENGATGNERAANPKRSRGTT